MFGNKQYKKAKRNSRKRIVEFSWKTPSGYRQSLNENDFYTRNDFLKERRSFKKNGIKIF